MFADDWLEESFFYSVSIFFMKLLECLLTQLISFAHIEQPEHQQLIVDGGVLPCLMDLLKRRNTCGNSQALSGLLKRVADAITNLAHENGSVKTRVRYSIIPHTFET